MRSGLLHRNVQRCGSEAGSYLRLIDFVYHSTLGLRVIKKKERTSQSEMEMSRRRRMMISSSYKLTGIGVEGLGCGVDKV